MEVTHLERDASAAGNVDDGNPLRSILVVGNLRAEGEPFDGAVHGEQLQDVAAMHLAAGDDEPIVHQRAERFARLPRLGHFSVVAVHDDALSRGGKYPLTTSERV